MRCVYQLVVPDAGQATDAKIFLERQYQTGRSSFWAILIATVDLPDPGQPTTIIRFILRPRHQ